MGLFVGESDGVKDLEKLKKKKQARNLKKE